MKIPNPSIKIDFKHINYSTFLYCRFERLKAKDNDFLKRFANLGNIYYKQGVTEFNWDSNIDDTLSTDH